MIPRDSREGAVYVYTTCTGLCENLSGFILLLNLVAPARDLLHKLAECHHKSLLCRVVLEIAPRRVRNKARMLHDHLAGDPPIEYRPPKEWLQEISVRDRKSELLDEEAPELLTSQHLPRVVDADPRHTKLMVAVGYGKKARRVHAAAAEHV